MALTKIPSELSSTTGIVDNSNATAITIDSNENVGIGTSSPNSKLDTGGDYYSGTATTVAQLTNKISTYSTLSQGSLYGFGQDSNGLHMTAGQAGQSLMFHTGGSAERVRIDGSGNLLVGTTSWTTGGGGLRVTPSGRSDFSRNTTSSTQAINFANPNGFVGNITLAGSTTTYNTSSDARLKDVTGEARGLEVINELNPVAYNWKADGKADEGLIAQEVQEIVPNAVSGSEEEHYQMDYSKLVVHLVKGMKEQQTQIEALQSEINLLKGE